jgi:CRP-like cAMP-binding protein
VGALLGAFSTVSLKESFAERLRREDRRNTKLRELKEKKAVTRPVMRRSKRLPLDTEALNENAILRHVEGAEAARLIEIGELFELPTKYAIYRAGEIIYDVYFPFDCVLSVVARLEGGEEIEVGTIGREGMSGIPLLMGGTTTENDCYCQVPGRAVKIPVAAFHALQLDEGFDALLDRYLQAYVNFLGQLTACNRLHTVYERCARWLLLTHDRVGRAEIRLTHEYLAMMLGSRRSGVSIALSTLQRAGYIRYAHGVITVLERAGLEETTCECYGVAQRQFTGFLRPAGTTPLNTG